MTLLPERERAIVWCPWGCGQPYNQHDSQIVCPPQRSDGAWLNSPTKALGATPQLQDDLKSLQAAQEAADCARCRTALGRRINVIENELKRRTGGMQ